jgi:hypothetical protein
LQGGHDVFHGLLFAHGNISVNLACDGYDWRARMGNRRVAKVCPGAKDCGLNCSETRQFIGAAMLYF